MDTTFPFHAGTDKNESSHANLSVLEAGKQYSARNQRCNPLSGRTPADPSLLGARAGPRSRGSFGLCREKPRGNGSSIGGEENTKPSGRGGKCISSSCVFHPTPPPLHFHGKSTLSLSLGGEAQFRLCLGTAFSDPSLDRLSSPDCKRGVKVRTYKESTQGTQVFVTPGGLAG